MNGMLLRRLMIKEGVVLVGIVVFLAVFPVLVVSGHSDAGEKSGHDIVRYVVSNTFVVGILFGLTIYTFLFTERAYFVGDQALLKVSPARIRRYPWRELSLSYRVSPSGGLCAWIRHGTMTIDLSGEKMVDFERFTLAITPFLAEGSESKSKADDAAAALFNEETFRMPAFMRYASFVGAVFFAILTPYAWFSEEHVEAGAVMFGFFAAVCSYLAYICTGTITFTPEGIHQRFWLWKAFVPFDTQVRIEASPWDRKDLIVRGESARIRIDQQYVGYERIVQVLRTMYPDSFEAGGYSFPVVVTQRGWHFAAMVVVAVVTVCGGCFMLNAVIESEGASLGVFVIYLATAVVALAAGPVLLLDMPRAFVFDVNRIVVRKFLRVRTYPVSEITDITLRKGQHPSVIVWLGGKKLLVPETGYSHGAVELYACLREVYFPEIQRDADMVNGDIL